MFNLNPVGGISNVAGLVYPVRLKLNAQSD